MMLVLKITLVLAAAAAANLVLRRAAASVRHLVWIAALVGCLALPLLDRALPKVTVPAAHTTIVFVERAGGVASTPSLERWLLPVWALVAVLLFCRLGAGHFELWRLSRRARPIARRDGVEVRESGEALMPLAWGILRPVVLIPEAAREWPDGLRRDAIDHELAHVRRGDGLAQLAAQIACCVYWFHPLVWWASALARDERERACDDLVLASGAGAADYASHLLEVARMQLQEPAFGEAIARRSSLESRVHSILGRNVSRRAAGRGVTALIAATAIALLVPLAVAQKDKKKETYKIGGDVAAPKLIHKVEPEYSERAREEKVAGMVKLYVEIDESGIPDVINVMEGLHPDLDQNAVRAVEQWRFSPGVKSGKPVRVAATIEVNFKLL